MGILYFLHQIILNPRKRKKEIHLHNTQNTISWVIYMFIKRLTKTVTQEFVTITKTLRDHTLSDIKTLYKTFFYSLKVLGMNATRFRNTLA